MAGMEPAHVTVPAAALADQLPPWATLVRAPNPGPMTLDGTNTWVLRAPGEDQAVVVDPGPLDEGHLRAVADAACRNRPKPASSVDAACRNRPKPASSAEHRPVRLIIATHGHSDHVEGIPRLRELCPEAELLAPSDGMELTAAGLLIRLVATPGHTADSYCLVVSSADGNHPAVLTGDTILGRGTTVVAWPDGNLSAYLASLRGLADLPSAGMVLPGHGPALADCAAAARFYLAHRQARLDQVRAALAAGARTPAEVVAAVYQDVERALWPAAELSVRAQLDYLGQEADLGVGETVERMPPRESSPGPVGLDTP
jgi:glyoxylase-like metal-dependent hydrolase (beta-lactamase superfamily II)